MALDQAAVNAIFNAVVSHALATGLFERVNQHEPKSAPGTGLTSAIWVDAIDTAPSGLAATSALLVLNNRLYTNMLAEPQDLIDPNLLTATSTLFAAYAGDFELGGNVRAVDLRGMSGTRLAARAGYIPQDNRLFRAYTITLPLIINDAWDEAA